MQCVEPLFMKPLNVRYGLWKERVSLLVPLVLAAKIRFTGVIPGDKLLWENSNTQTSRSDQSKKKFR